MLHILTKKISRKQRNIGENQRIRKRKSIEMRNNQCYIEAGTSPKYHNGWQAKASGKWNHFTILRPRNLENQYNTWENNREMTEIIIYLSKYLTLRPHGYGTREEERPTASRRKWKINQKIKMKRPHILIEEIFPRRRNQQRSPWKPRKSIINVESPRPQPRERRSHTSEEMAERKWRRKIIREGSREASINRRERKWRNQSIIEEIAPHEEIIKEAYRKISRNVNQWNNPRNNRKWNQSSA